MFIYYLFLIVENEPWLITLHVEVIFCLNGQFWAKISEQN